MDNETDQVLTPEIVPTEESNSLTVGNAAILALTAIGGVKVVRYAAAKLPFTIVRKTKVVETPQVVPAPPVDAPVAAE